MRPQEGADPRGSVWERRPEAAWTAREPFLQQSGARRSLRPANAAPAGTKRGPPEPVGTPPNLPEGSSPSHVLDLARAAPRRGTAPSPEPRAVLSEPGCARRALPCARWAAVDQLAPTRVLSLAPAGTPRTPSPSPHSACGTFVTSLWLAL